MENKGQKDTQSVLQTRSGIRTDEQIVLDKPIFSNIFNKDIQRVYIYKKSERIAKALNMVCPALKDCKPIRERVEKISLELIDASLLPPQEAKDPLSRLLLTLSSVLSLAKAGGFLSPMNADIIIRETHNLLQEVALYDDPRIELPEAPSVARIAREAGKSERAVSYKTLSEISKRHQEAVPDVPLGQSKEKSGRREAILSILKSKGPSYIKDISMVIRDVSEKTIQRELQQLVLEGSVERKGERRWTTYTLSSAEGVPPKEKRVSVDFMTLS